MHIGAVAANGLPSPASIVVVLVSTAVSIQPVLQEPAGREVMASGGSGWMVGWVLGEIPSQKER